MAYGGIGGSEDRRNYSDQTTKWTDNEFGQIIVEIVPAGVDTQFNHDGTVMKNTPSGFNVRVNEPGEKKRVEGQNLSEDEAAQLAGKWRSHLAQKYSVQF